MADRIVVLRGGRVEQIGRPLDLYDRPANPFVASFIGSPSMNFLRGRSENGAFHMGGDESLPLPANMGAVATYGVRPEHISIDPTGPIAAEVELVEPMGSETQVTFRRLGASNGSRIAGLFRERIDLAPGSQVHLRPDPKHVHLFGTNDLRLN